MMTNLEIEVLECDRMLTPEQKFELLTPENKAAVIRQIELLRACQSSGR